MAANLARLVRGALRRAGGKLIALSERIPGPAPRVPAVEILERQGDWVVCRTGDFVWRLDPGQCVDNDILDDGLFEPHSTRWVERLVKPGMVAADVGANIGYYTVRFSRLVGPEGRVHAFEPSARYRERLLDHLQRNGCENVNVMDYGLSDSDRDERLYGDEISASMHWHDDAKPPTVEETIKLRTLDSYVDEARLPRLDFVKVDIDGHEPRFVAGAARALARFRPVLLMEFSQLSLMAAGSGVEHLARQLADLDYSLYSERTGQPYSSRTSFIVDAMNCSHSVNVICRPGPPRASLVAEGRDRLRPAGESVAAGGSAP